MTADDEQVARAAARTKAVLPSHLIGVSYARIPDRRLHVHAGDNAGRQNGAAVAVGRGVDWTCGMIAEDDRRADEVSGLVKTLGPVNTRIVIHPCDDEAAVRKSS